MTGFTALTAVTIAGAMVFGIVSTFLGSIKLSLADRLQLKESRIAALLSVLHLALIPMTLLSGYLITVWSIKGVLIIGALLVALGLALLAIKVSYEWALAAVLAIGAGGACLSAASVVLMPKAFQEPVTQLVQPTGPDSRKHSGDDNGDHQKRTEKHQQDTKETTAALNLGNVFVGLGALLAPTAVALLLYLFGFRRMLFGLASLCLVPAALAAITPIEGNRGGTQLEHIVLHRDVPMLLAGLVCFLYFPIQFAVSTWGTTYLRDQGYKDWKAEMTLSLFWLAFLSSQLGVALLEMYGYLPSAFDPWLILLLAFLAGLGLGGLAGASTNAHTAFGLVMVGAALGPIFPTLIGIVFNHLSEEKQWGTGYGMVFAIGSIGSLLLSPFIGLYAHRNSVREALRIPMILAFILSGTAIALALALQIAPAAVGMVPAVKP